VSAMPRERLYLFDTTLRDGAQMNGVDFTLHDKLSIAKLLDELGIDYIEGGYPGANPTDTDLFSKERKLGATFTAFGMTRRPGRSTSNDPGLATLLDAKSIAFLRVGSGIHVAGVLERLGIADAVRSKVTRPESDIVSELVGKGQIELGLVVMTQILTTPGVDLVGPLPPELQSYVVFTAGVSATSKVPAAGEQLMRFLTGPIAIPVIAAQGMEPLPLRRPLR